MKKRLVILTLVLAAAAPQLNANSGAAAKQVNQKDFHSSSLNKMQAHKAASSQSDLLVQAGHTSNMLDGNSPSNRKNNHWKTRANAADASAAPAPPAEKVVPKWPAMMRRWEVKPRRKFRKNQIEAVPPTFFVRDCIDTDDQGNADIVQQNEKVNRDELSGLVTRIAESGLF